MYLRSLSGRITRIEIMEEYWTSETEDALAEYVTTNDMDEKNRLFTECLHEPLKKLIDANIKRYRIPIVDEDLKLSILTDVVMRVERFRPNVVLPSGRKSTGRAYCSILIRSWFADWNLKRSRQKNMMSLDEILKTK